MHAGPPHLDHRAQWSPCSQAPAVEMARDMQAPGQWVRHGILLRAPSNARALQDGTGVEAPEVAGLALEVSDDGVREHAPPRARAVGHGEVREHVSVHHDARSELFAWNLHEDDAMSDAELDALVLRLGQADVGARGIGRARFSSL